MIYWFDDRDYFAERIINITTIGEKSGLALTKNYV